ncbi:hypothetical protein [Methylobacterium aquaticum]|uniref:hypothetical protein n=1 Tax=Methylobacterium aquaticum TaxID=270351 RepID=UPI001932226F|nr:hypothetical protein [Methylobacterium aquaticum]QRE76331.1 hypothetical protein F1D61_24665 [Methylobacterium aquaticum]
MFMGMAPQSVDGIDGGRVHSPPRRAGDRIRLSRERDRRLAGVMKTTSMIADQWLRLDRAMEYLPTDAASSNEAFRSISLVFKNSFSPIGDRAKAFFGRGPSAAPGGLGSKPDRPARDHIDAPAS